MAFVGTFHFSFSFCLVLVDLTMIAKVSLLCALVALVHGGAPLLGLGAAPLGYGAIGGLGLGVRTIAAPGIGLASPLGLRGIGGYGAIGGLGLAGVRTIAAPGIGLASPLGLRTVGGYGAIGGLGLGASALGVRTIAAPGIGLAAPLGLRGIGGYGAIGGLGLATAGIKVAAPVATVAKAVIAAPQPYSFGYGRQTDDGAAVSRQESSDEGNNRQGSYSIQNPDGTYRVVTYVADAAGFRAVVKTNEHGTAPQNPAATQILAEEPPYKVLPAPAPIVKTAAIGLASPLIAKAGVPALGLGYGGIGVGGLGLVHG